MVEGRVPGCGRCGGRRRWPRVNVIFTTTPPLVGRRRAHGSQPPAFDFPPPQPRSRVFFSSAPRVTNSLHPSPHRIDGLTGNKPRVKNYGKTRARSEEIFCVNVLTTHRLYTLQCSIIQTKLYKDDGKVVWVRFGLVMALWVERGGRDACTTYVILFTTAIELCK